MYLIQVYILIFIYDYHGLWLDEDILSLGVVVLYLAEMVPGATN